MIPAPSLSHSSFLVLYCLLDCSLKLKLLQRLSIMAVLRMIELYVQLLLFVKERIFFQDVPINCFQCFYFWYS